MAQAPSLPPAFAVVHVPQASRFEVVLDGHRAICDYRQSGDVLELPHTVVPPALEGRGIAAAMVAAALAWARGQGWKVRPTCSYVAAYMRRRPETGDLLAP